MDPVNLTNLRSMTDGDRDMEKELFEQFYLSFTDGMDILKANCGEASHENWRRHAHALKGIALNLGAERLSALCKQGQDNPLATQDAKVALLADIREEYARVEQFMRSIS